MEKEVCKFIRHRKHYEWTSRHFTKLAFTCSKLAIETLEQDVKYVQRNRFFFLNADKGFSCYFLFLFSALRKPRWLKCVYENFNLKISKQKLCNYFLYEFSCTFRVLIWNNCLVLTLTDDYNRRTFSDMAEAKKPLIVMRCVSLNHLELGFSSYYVYWFC